MGAVTNFVSGLPKLTTRWVVGAVCLRIAIWCPLVIVAPLPERCH
jgi:hypothetical protein